MPHEKRRVGYITFEGLDGPRRLFYFDEPLALGLLRVLERAANSAGGSGMAGELDPSVHNPAAIERARRRANRPVTLGDVEAARIAYLDAQRRYEADDGRHYEELDAELRMGRA